MYEHRKAPLLSWRAFLARVALHAGIGILIILICLGVGMLGYHYFESMSWLDAFANASMILSGMGPFGPLQTDSGKLFAGLYALFSGLAFITTAGIILAPVAHRLMHKFHLESHSDS
ncbi:MAG: hypothetical protein D4R81_02305 [Nitrospiraceae bacterium]|nr:MAG: hypothetical protein D4R81_02305 [Nitrospiraceae bacterium]